MSFDEKMGELAVHWDGLNHEVVRVEVGGDVGVHAGDFERLLFDLSGIGGDRHWDIVRVERRRRARRQRHYENQGLHSFFPLAAGARSPITPNRRRWARHFSAIVRLDLARSRCSLLGFSVDRRDGATPAVGKGVAAKAECAAKPSK